jgi:hypothetical protein
MKRFIVKGGIVRDMKTELEWEEEVNSHQMTWDEAQEYAEALRLGGYDDWRVPTRLELESLLNLEKANPASDFPGMPSVWFWSSSPYVFIPGHAWTVDFDYGVVSFGGKYYDYYYVRYVRRAYFADGAS